VIGLAAYHFRKDSWNDLFPKMEVHWLELTTP
jgi:hypothetical protein